MKRVSFLMIAIVLANDSFAQTNIFPASGNVGIGTTSPGAPLEVRPPVLTGGDVNRTVVLYSDIYNTGSNGQNLALTALTNNGAHAGWNFSSDWNSRLSFGVFTNSSFNTAPNEYLSIVSGGNVGIGTITPAHKLDIVGDGINLENTTYTNQHGIIFKNGIPFISDFNYGNNGTVTTDGSNTFVGINAGNFTMGSTANSAGQASYNTVIGQQSFMDNTTGYANTADGFAALMDNSTGLQNTAIGFEALIYNTSGNYNTASGTESLYSNTAGDNNTAIGYEALSNNITASDNTAVGFTALGNNTSGVYNTATGYEALVQNTIGNSNTAAGYAALYKNTTGNYNTSNGYEALFANTTGNANTASGYVALPNNSSGWYNTAFGSEALYYTTTGSNNSAVGYAALDGNTTGGSNTANGFEAGLNASNSSANSGSSSSVFIGASSESLTGSDNNEIVIGYNAIGAGSNSVVLGNTSITKTLLQGNVLIGKTSQTNTSYKLDVNGNIRANQVTVNATGADYVFDSTYHLPPISSLSKYINKYHHLPGVSSAQQMEKDGLSIGDTEMQLLQKMEEMTLYMIKMNKKLQAMEMQVNGLKSVNKHLNTEIKKLKEGEK